MSPDSEGRDRVRELVRRAAELRLETPRPLMRELPPPDPFPLDSLGAVLAPAAHAIQDRVQASIAICGQSVLAAATLTVQAHADIELPTKQVRPLTGFFVTVAASGERKTAVDDEALRPIRQREATLRTRHNFDLLNFNNENLAWTKARDAAIKKKTDPGAIKAALEALGPAPVPPLEPLLTCPEPTYEGLCKHLAVGQPSIGIFAAEGGQFIGGHGMSEEAKLRTAAGLSAVWDGEPIKRVRGGDGLLILPGRRVTMHLMAQPEVAAIALNDPLLASQGLLSRILITAPETAAGTRLWREERPETAGELKRYEAGLLRILDADLPLAPGKPNELEPRRLPLATDARPLWVEFADHVEKAIGAGGELEPIRGLANKLPEHAARLAAILTLVRDLKSTAVEAEEMQAGIELTEHYAAEALRLFGSSRVNAELFLARRLLDWLHRRWTEPVISLPDIYQRSLNAIADQATARKLVTVLEDHGWLIKKPEGGIVSGVRRRDVWMIVRQEILP